MKVPFVIYPDLDSLLEKMKTCHDNPEKSWVTKINEHTPSGYSLSHTAEFDTTKNKFDYYRDKNCIKHFCVDLKEHATKITEKKEMTPLTNEERKMRHVQKVLYICKKGFSTYYDNKKYNVREHCHSTVDAHNICNLRYKAPKEIHVVFQNAGGKSRGHQRDWSPLKLNI